MMIVKSFQERREAMIEYILAKVQEGDWHGVSDAAIDLRVMEARHDAEQEAYAFLRPGDTPWQ